jgi:hypothetical protein
VLTCRTTIGAKPRYVCSSTTTTFAANILGDWSVNGVPGGNTTVGTVRGPEFADYTAPQEVPSPSRVTLTATVTDSQGKLTAPLVAHVDVVDAKDYGGRYEFQQSQGSGVVAHPLHRDQHRLPQTTPVLPQRGREGGDDELRHASQGHQHRPRARFRGGGVQRAAVRTVGR